MEGGSPALATFLLLVPNRAWKDLYMIIRIQGVNGNYNTVITAILLTDLTHINTFFILIFFAPLANLVCIACYMYWPIHYNKMHFSLLRNRNVNTLFTHLWFRKNYDNFVTNFISWHLPHIVVMFWEIVYFCMNIRCVDSSI